MVPGIITSQTGGRQFDAPNFTKYSGFLGGLNATHHALKNYSPLMFGYNRLFMVRPPLAVMKMFAGSDANLYSSDSLFIQFKHMLEYFNRSNAVSGGKTLELAATPFQGGFAGRQISLPTVVKDEARELTIGLHEFVGSPVATVLDGWMNAIGDQNSGFATYGGWISGGMDANKKHKRLYRRPNESDDGIEFNEANHTAEFIYVLMSRSGAEVERAMLLADAFPLGYERGNYFHTDIGGVHDLVTLDVRFNCIAYESPIITAIANDLLKQYRIVTNCLNFNPELGDAVYDDNNTGLFQRSLGPVPVDSASGTKIGNVPAYYTDNAPKTVVMENKDINIGKLSGQPGYQPQVDWEGFGLD